MATAARNRRRMAEDEGPDFACNSKSARYDEGIEAVMGRRLLLSTVVEELEALERKKVPSYLCPAQFVKALVVFAQTTNPSSWRRLFDSSGEEVTKIKEYQQLRQIYHEILMDEVRKGKLVTFQQDGKNIHLTEDSM